MATWRTTWHASSASRKSRALVFACLCAVVVALYVVAAAPPRILAIGDIHGSLDGFVAILTRAGLVDGARAWSGGAAMLVQTGDYTDRGEGVRGVMDLLMALEPQAKKAGGEVIVLLGNHEVMNLIGETRDVTPEIFATFADSNSESRRENAWRQYEQLAKNRQNGGTPPAGVYTQSREAWMAAHPPGYLEYREAFAPRGTYGRWLRDKAPTVRIEGTAFMHAGINASAGEMDLDDVNRAVKNEVARFDAYLRGLVDRKLALPFFTLKEVLAVTAAELKVATDKVAAQKEGREAPSPTLDARLLQEALAVNDIGTWNILAPDGPMWFRGYATWPDTAGSMVATLLKRVRADRIVVGHTPLSSAKITARFDNRVFLIDTGMLASVYRGRPSALEIDGVRIRALYPNEEVTLVGN
jgi:hypothetical protein